MSEERAAEAAPASASAIEPPKEGAVAAASPAEATKEAGSATASAAGPAAPPAPRPWILAVDESRLQLRSYDQVFSVTRELKRFDVTGCASWSEAVERLSLLRAKDAKPSLILAEWRKPFAATMEFLALLKKDVRWNRIPVLVVAGSAADGAAAQEVLHDGIRDCVLKPIKTNLLVEKVNRLVNGEALPGVAASIRG